MKMFNSVAGRFPHYLSAWWVPALLLLGWGPLLLGDVAEYFFPHMNDTYGGAALAMAWGLDVMLPTIILAGISIVIQMVRAIKALFF